MRSATMLLAVVVLASPVGASAQAGGKGKVPPYYYYIQDNCAGKKLEVTLKSGERLSGRCHAQLADRFQLTSKGVTYDVHYHCIEKIKVKRRWLSKLKDAAVAPYSQIKLAIGMAGFYNDFL